MSASSRVGNVSLITLLIANGLAIWQFSVSGGDIIEVLWIYWLQSVIIGLVNVWRIITVPLKVTALNNVQVPKNILGANNTAGPLVRFGAAAFFVLHYGLFHLGYAAFLAIFSKPGVAINGLGSEATTTDQLFTGHVSMVWLVISALTFAVHHTITFLIERKQLKMHPETAPDIQEVMGRPYSRIIPMHMIIIFGPWITFLLGNTYVFVFFMLLKTIADFRLFYKGSGHPGTINPSHAS